MRLFFTLLLPVLLASCNSGGGSNIIAPTMPPVETPIPGADDPLASEAWHLENTGQKSYSASAGIAGEDLKIKPVIDGGIKGQGIRIAVSDTGVDINHPDLSTNQVSSQHRSYASDTPSTWRGTSPYPVEHEGHGTAVAGLVSAEGWNGIGSRGVAPSSNYGAFLFVGDFHSSYSSYEAKLIDQMTGNFDIFNYSYGYSGCEFVKSTQTVLDAYKLGVTNLRSGKGAIYIQAAGNEYSAPNEDCTTGDSSYYFGNTNTSEDHNHPYIILVGASNARGKISSYSTPGSGLWVTTAGGEYGQSSPALISTDILGCTWGLSSSQSSIAGFNKGTSPNSRCDYTSIMNGTSAATPVLSGIVALMLEANPLLTWRDVKHILAVTADKINYSTSAIPHPAGTGASLPGYVYDYLYVKNSAGVDFSNTYGFGRVNAENAVNMAKTYTFPLGTYQESSFYSSGTIDLPIPDKDASGVEHTVNVSDNLTIESVQIKISTDHSYLGDLAIELQSPSGTVSRILTLNSNINDGLLSDYIMISNAFYGESSAGDWKIKIIDGAEVDTGKLQSWKIKVNGH